jgi:hypothetical protein
MSGTLGIGRTAIGRAAVRELPIAASILLALVITGGIVVGLSALVDRFS